jgi:hypothetical protein
MTMSLIEPSVQTGQPTSIQKLKVVLCEGIEETRFLPRLFIAVGKPELNENIQFLPYNGKAKLGNFITNGLVKMPGYDSITSLGIMMDAYGDPEGVKPSFNSVKYAMRLIEFPIPKKPGVLATQGNLKSIAWILPDNLSGGEFEDICVNAVANQPMYSCIAPLRKCIEKKGCAIPRSAKAPLYTILAWNEPCGRRLGEISNDFIRSWDLSAFDNVINNFFSQL